MKMNHMRKLLLLLAIFAATGCASSDKPAAPVSVMSFNIRYANTHDGENAWVNRKEAVVRMLDDVRPAILGIQEGLADQVAYLDSALTGYEFAGVGRDDGMMAGEYAAIFYDTTRFQKISSGNFWLSETPAEPTMGWDAVCIRIATWVKLRDKQNNRDLAFINTHFDHVGRAARLHSAQMIADSIASIGAGVPMVITGDFNSEVDDPALKVITETPSVFEVRAMVGDVGQGPDYTFMGFEGNPDDRSLIDHIFVKGMKAQSYKVIADTYGIPQLSDHLPVFAVLEYE